MNIDQLVHEALLPRTLVERVPEREKLILSFVLAFLEDQRLPAQLLVNGGYVRDLLLGKQPDDLDLSLCLRECPPEVTLATVMEAMPGFALRRPELQISTVQITTILSDTSKDKNVDTAKAYLGVGQPAVKVEVDFMPTIGEETYDDNDRVPTRDVRGTPAQDALRRDLTIGAMLLEVTAAPPEGEGAPPAAPLDAHAAANALRWRLLDFYGGLADLQRGVLRSPYPRDRSAAAVWAEVLRAPHERALAARLGFGWPPDAAAPATAAAPAAAADEAAEAAEAAGGSAAGGVAGAAASLSPRRGEEAWLVQVVWWVKVLRDDPLRVLRALRFSAKLGFGLHAAFWGAVPFALPSLQTKVAGARKSTELLKIARAGRPPLLDFLQLAFGRRLPASAEQPLPCLAPALFGGADAKGQARFLTACDGFDAAAMRAAAAALPAALGAEESLGACLAAATHACALPSLCALSVDEGGAACAGAADAAGAAGGGGGGAGGGAGGGGAGGGGAGGGGDDAAGAAGAADAEDAAGALAAAAALEEVTSACDGLGASNEVRQAAETPLACVRALLRPPAAQGQHAVFAAACGAPAALGGVEVTPAEFAALVHLWETLKLDKVQQGKRPTGVLPEFALALAAARCSAATARRLEARLAALSAPGPQISGKSLLALDELPQHMRGALMSQLHVLCRLRAEPVPLTSGEQLVAYLAARGGLLERLVAEWYEEGEEAQKDGRKRQLKPPYAPPQKGPRKK